MITRTLAALLAALLVGGPAPAAAASLIPTSTTFSLPDAPIAMGTAVELRATVSPDPGSGTVGFFVNNVLWATGAVGPSGIAVAAVPDGIPWLGDIPVFAWFEGNGTYAQSDSRPAVTVSVIDTRPPVSVTLVTSPNPALRGDRVGLHAVITPNPGDGQVAVCDGPCGSAIMIPVAEDGTADRETTFSTSGTHALTACYLGDGRNGPACSPVVEQVVTSYTSSTVLTIEPATIYPDQRFTIGITVTPPPEIKTIAHVGVTPWNNDVLVEIDPATGHGEATVIPDPSHLHFGLGAYDLRAYFPGTDHVDASTSGVVRLAVRYDDATVDVTTSANAAATMPGEPLTFSAHVTPTPEEPTAAIGVSVYGPAGSGFGDAVEVDLGPDGTGQTTVDTDHWPAGDYWYEAYCCGDPHLAPVSVRGYFTLGDVDPPHGRLTVAGGSDVVINSAVSAEVPATDGVGSGVKVVALSNDGNTWTSMPYAEKVPWNLSAGDGTKTVRAKWQDQAGNWSPVVTDSIVVNTSAAKLAPPTVSLASGTSVSSGRAPVKIAWTRAVAGPGVVGYRLDQSVDGGGWSVAAANITGTSTTRFALPGHTYRFRVRAIDGAGGVGPWAVQPTPITLTAYQQTSTPVSYHGHWAISRSTAFWGGSVMSSSTVGSTSTFKSLGRGAAWVSETGPTRGTATIWVNGAKVATVNLYSAASQRQRVVWRAVWSGTAARTVVIRVSGTVGRPRVDVDGFLALR